MSARLTSRHRTTGVLAAAAMLVAGCSSGAHHSTTTTTTAPSPTASSSAQVVAHRFVMAYVRVLEGEVPAAALPDATTATRQTARSAGPIPARARTAQLRVTRLVKTQGAWAVVMRDGDHALSASFVVSRHGGGWEVIQLTPPDFSTQLEPPAHTAGPRLPKGAAAPAAAARGFLREYLPFEYGHAHLGALRDLTPKLRTYLRHNTPRLIAPLHPRVLAFAIHRAGATWVATPSVGDGVNTYQVTITLVRRHGRWLANAVPPPNYSATPAPGGQTPSTSTTTQQLVSADTGVTEAAQIVIEGGRGGDLT